MAKKYEIYIEFKKKNASAKIFTAVEFDCMFNYTVFYIKTETQETGKFTEYYIPVSSVLSIQIVVIPQS